MTTDLPAAGIEIQILRGERVFPESWTEPWAALALHNDGSRCTAECGCVDDKALTSIRCGENITTNDGWTWMTFQAPLVVGYHRTGPSETELRLEANVDELEEDLAKEQILHGLTREDVAACEADIETMQARRTAIRASLRRSRKATADAEGRYGVAYQAAWAGWSAAILIAALWISAVIG